MRFDISSFTNDHFAFILLVVKTYLACSNKHLLVLYICGLLYTENLIKTRIFESWYMYYIESQFSRLNQYPLVLPLQSSFFLKLLYITILKQTYIYMIWMFIDNYFLDTTLYPFLDFNSPSVTTSLLQGTMTKTLKLSYKSTCMCM